MRPEDQMRLELEEIIDKYCYRMGRHGETYLLEKGIKTGLIDKLVQYITNSKEK